jgi:hypothetical protein
MIKKIGKSIAYKLLRLLARRLNVRIADAKMSSLISGFKDKYGYIHTVNQDRPVDADLVPIPWFTYPAIEYISQLDLSDKNIFEWGSGNSSLFFSKRCKSLISVESDKGWYRLIEENRSPNQKLLFCDPEKLADAIGPFDKFDVIIIDTANRYNCAINALKHLSDGGLIILDNSDWYANTSKILREEGNLIEVDMHGFGPINGYSWTTSFYFHRKFNFTPLHDRQPHYSKAKIAQTVSDDFDTSGSIGTPDGFK